MFKIDNKDTRTTSVTSGAFITILHIVHTFFFCFYCSLWRDKRHIKNKKANMILKYIVSIGLGIHFKNVRMCLTPLEVLC